MKKRLSCLLAAPLLACAMPALADYPDRPITLIVPAAPGGAADILARLVGKAIGDELVQPVVVENKPGAAATIGMTTIARAKNDGYTIGMVFAGPMAVNPNLYKALRYSPKDDFDPISLVAISPLVIAASSSLKVRTVKDLAALAKANPEKLTFGSAGTGSTQHLCMELFKSTADVNMMHVPYKGTSPATVDLLSGIIPLMCDNVISIMPQFKDGKIIPLAVTTAKRISALPDVPTVSEAGYPGFEANGWYGMVAPAGTDKGIVQKLSLIVNKLIQSDATRQLLIQQGMEPLSNTPQEFAAYIERDTQKWARVVKQAGIEPQ